MEAGNVAVGPDHERDSAGPVGAHLDDHLDGKTRVVGEAVGRSLEVDHSLSLAVEDGSPCIVWASGVVDLELCEREGRRGYGSNGPVEVAVVGDELACDPTRGLLEKKVLGFDHGQPRGLTPAPADGGCDTRVGRRQQRHDGGLKKVGSCEQKKHSTGG